MTGPEEYFVSGSIPGISIWADGISTINCAFLDAKYSRGSFGPYESDPRALGSFVAQVGKYVELIADPEVPLNKLKILTNSTGAVAVFRALLATLTTKFAIPVEVRLQPARPYMGE